MPTTSNFGWTTPADTDLVKDGAAAIRTLGNGIDTSLVDLKGGTTNQVLAKNSNTDLDFKWVADASGIPATIFDAKGDIIAATAADTADRLAVGTNGDVLTADSTTATGLKWAAVQTAANWSLVNTGGTALTGANLITVSGITNADKIFVIIDGASAAAGAWINLRLNTDTGNNYKQWGTGLYGTTTWNKANIQGETLGTQSQIWLARLSTNGGSVAQGYLSLSGGNASGLKMVQFSANADNAGGTDTGGYIGGGWYSGTSTISSISLRTSDSSNFDAGSVFVYTSA